MNVLDATELCAPHQLKRSILFCLCGHHKKEYRAGTGKVPPDLWEVEGLAWCCPEEAT